MATPAGAPLCRLGSVRGVSGLWFACRRGTQDVPVSGEAVEDLADPIARAERLREGPAGGP